MFHSSHTELALIANKPRAASAHAVGVVTCASESSKTYLHGGVEHVVELHLHPPLIHTLLPSISSLVYLSLSLSLSLSLFLLSLTLSSSFFLHPLPFPPCPFLVLEVGAFERLLGPCMDIMKRNFHHYEEQLMQLFGTTLDITDTR